jgi:hypothetical protein
MLRLLAVECAGASISLRLRALAPAVATQSMTSSYGTEQKSRYYLVTRS